MTKPTLLFLVTEDGYFYSHRLPMARAAQNAGFDVAVITNVSAHQEKIEAAGVRVIPLSLDRRSLNPLKALCHIKKIYGIYKKEKPALVHHIAMKPVLYGSIAARMAKVPHVVNAFAGLGYVFTAQTMKARGLRSLLTGLFRFLLKAPGSHLLLQNDDDLALLKRLRIVPEGRSHVIRGSGVDTERFSAQPFPAPAPDVICVFAGRMIAIKGLPTLKMAFALLKERAPHIKLWLCGRPDPANPGSWTEEQLHQWDVDSDNVSYKGYCSDMTAIWAQAHVALQPSYGGEGVPKALLDAGACGRAFVATDVAGCRDVAHDGENGYLVPSHDAEALAQAIEKLAADPARCEVMGQKSREIIERDFSAAAVMAQTEALYKAVLKS